MRAQTQPKCGRGRPHPAVFLLVQGILISIAGAAIELQLLLLRFAQCCGGVHAGQRGAVARRCAGSLVARGRRVRAEGRRSCRAVLLWLMMAVWIARLAGGLVVAAAQTVAGGASAHGAPQPLHPSPPRGANIERRQRKRSTHRACAPGLSPSGRPCCELFSNSRPRRDRAGAWSNQAWCVLAILKVHGVAKKAAGGQAAPGERRCGPDADSRAPGRRTPPQ